MKRTEKSRNKEIEWRKSAIELCKKEIKLHREILKKLLEGEKKNE